jgi:large subunit ribosomal protein L4
MSSIDIVDATGSTSGSVDLPPEIFDAQVNIPLIHQVVVAQLAAARQGTHNTKNRGDVAGGGRKPYRQKGTGRARQGSIRAPQYAGGGIVHGPTPRDYAQRTPKKMKAAALRGALSDRARDGRVHVVQSFVPDETPSTKAARATLARVTQRPRALVVLQHDDRVTWLSLRNIDTIHVLAVDQLNTYDVLACDDVVFSKAAFDAFVAGRTKDSPATASAPSQAPASDASTGHDWPGSAQPLADGAAPAGHPIKGNATSMKYHRPDGRWYDQTDADVWFATVEDAERAGFVEAGSEASLQANEEETR